MSSNNSRARRVSTSAIPTPSRSKSSRVSLGPQASGIPVSRRSKGRQSMIPRMGRENAAPTTPSSVVSSSSFKTTASSRRHGTVDAGISSKSKNTEPATPSSVASSFYKTTASSRRLSIVDGATSSRNNRRQSYAPQPNQQKVDERPINDKAFQRTCINKLYDFLKSNHYEYPVNLKSLNRPSTKDFQTITTFMLRLIDGSFGKGDMKFEDEVHMNFKCLGYPFNISKTALVAAGTTHTWPSLLAALSWLMDQITYIQSYKETDELNDASPAPESIPELETKTEKAFMQYLGKSYPGYMVRDEYMIEQLDQQLIALIKKDDDAVEEDLETILENNESIGTRIEEVRKKGESLPRYEQRRQELAEEYEQYCDLVRQQQKQKEASEKTIQDNTDKLAQTNNKVAQKKETILNLKKTIEAQELTVEDVRKMESELKGFEEATDRAKKNLDKHKKALLNNEEDLVQVCNSAEILVTEFNNKLLELQVNPALGNRFSNLKARFNKDNLHSSNLNDILGVDLEHSVYQKATTAKNEFLMKIECLRTEHADLLDQVSKSENALNEAKAKLMILKEKIGKCDQTLASEQQSYDSKIAVRKREIATFESKASSLCDPVALEEKMATFERQCAELESLLESTRAENAMHRQAVVAEIESAMTLMEEHQSYLTEKIKQVRQLHEEKVGETKNIVKPSNLDKK